LVLQHLFHEGLTSRADLARATGLTRVTVAETATDLLGEGLIEEHGVQRGGTGKPALLLAMSTHGFQIVAIDVTGAEELRGAVLTLRGMMVTEASMPVDGATGADLVDKVEDLIRALISQATAAILGVGIGAPGIIGADGTVHEASNRGWSELPLAEDLTDRLGIPVSVANDANVAALGEYSFGEAADSILCIAAWQGVGAGLVIEGKRIDGAHGAAGEIGHVTIDDDGALCACGRYGCLETVLAEGAIREAIAGQNETQAVTTLAGIGVTVGTALAPIAAALNLDEILFNGPEDLLDGVLLESAEDTLAHRMLITDESRVRVRMANLGADSVILGAASLVLSTQLGVS
jgi:predicted NBD/HSP70 family sugar kinase